MITKIETILNKLTDKNDILEFSNLIERLEKCFSYNLISKLSGEPDNGIVSNEIMLLFSKYNGFIKKVGENDFISSKNLKNDLNTIFSNFVE